MHIRSATLSTLIFCITLLLVKESPFTSIDLVSGANGARNRRAATARLDRLWDDAIIPYEIDPIFSEERAALFRAAMRHWENYTCIQFVERQPEEHRNYIVFTERSCGCCSFVGKRGNGPQAISIGRHCDKFGIVVHELGHVVGFWHEHTRPDRDQHVQIIAKNIMSGQEYNFNKLTKDEVNSLGLAYDYDSILHYATNTFARDTYLDTILPLHGHLNTEVVASSESSPQIATQTEVNINTNININESSAFDLTTQTTTPLNTGSATLEPTSSPSINNYTTQRSVVLTSTSGPQNQLVRQQQSNSTANEQISQHDPLSYARLEKDFQSMLRYQPNWDPKLLNSNKQKRSTQRELGDHGSAVLGPDSRLMLVDGTIVLTFKTTTQTTNKSRQTNSSDEMIEQGEKQKQPINANKNTNPKLRNTRHANSNHNHYHGHHDLEDRLHMLAMDNMLSRSRPEIGQRIKLSVGDIAQTNLLYKCPKCGRTIQQAWGSFNSPAYQHHQNLVHHQNLQVKRQSQSKPTTPAESGSSLSSSGSDCEWRLTASQGERIMLNITDLDLAPPLMGVMAPNGGYSLPPMTRPPLGLPKAAFSEARGDYTSGEQQHHTFGPYNPLIMLGCVGDYLEVRDGYTYRSPLVARLCGHIASLRDSMRPIVSTGHRLLVTYKTSFLSNNKRGFMAHHETVCGGTILLGDSQLGSGSPSRGDQIPSPETQVYHNHHGSPNLHFHNLVPPPTQTTTTTSSTTSSTSTTGSSPQPNQIITSSMMINTHNNTATGTSTTKQPNTSNNNTPQIAVVAENELLQTSTSNALNLTPTLIVRHNQLRPNEPSPLGRGHNSLTSSSFVGPITTYSITSNAPNDSKSPPLLPMILSQQLDQQQQPATTITTPKPTSDMKPPLTTTTTTATIRGFNDNNNNNQQSSVMQTNLEGVEATAPSNNGASGSRIVMSTTTTTTTTTTPRTSESAIRSSSEFNIISNSNPNINIGNNNNNNAPTISYSNNRPLAPAYEGWSSWPPVNASTIQSPNWPEHYRPNRECVWQVKAPENHQISMRFESLDLEAHDSCAYDYVEIRDGGSDSTPQLAGPLLAKVCDRNRAPEMVLSSGQSLWVKFVSDGDVNKSGFMASLRAQLDECKLGTHGCAYKCSNNAIPYRCECPQGLELAADGKNCIPTCGGFRMEATGQISSPSHPDLYPLSTKCIWDIIAPAHHKISLNFTHFDLEGVKGQECEYDYVSVRSRVDSGVDTIQQPARYTKNGLFCGQIDNPFNVISLGNVMRIEFNSDNSIQKGGFKADYFFDKDECAINNGGCKHACSNTIGSYQCSCDNGFLLHDNKHDCIEGHCTHTIGTPEGIFQSPNFPLQYQPNKECAWFFSTAPGHRKKLIFDVFDLESHQECAFDHIVVYDGPSADDIILGRFCGSRKPLTLISSFNMLHLLFRSDASNERKGFNGTHTTVCGGRLPANVDHHDLIFSHPSFDGVTQYGKNEECEWVIEAFDHQRVLIEFTFFALEADNNCNYDHVLIFDGPDDAAPLLGRLCGSELTKNQTRMISSRESMMIVFRSDDSINQKGFSLSFTAIETTSSS